MNVIDIWMDFNVNVSKNAVLCNEMRIYYTNNEQQIDAIHMGYLW